VNPLIGIFGGAFDPVHIGHLRLAIELQQRLGLQRVHLIPTGTPVHREGPVASGEQRLTMLRLAIDGEVGLHVDAREVERNEPSFMVETMNDMRRQYPAHRQCLLIGMDQFAAFDSWYRWEDILDTAHIVVIQRNAVTPPTYGAMAQALAERQINDVKDLADSETGRILFINAPLLDVSSTRVRLLIATGRGARYLVPDGVLDFIKREGLYTNGK
jgi:nicotinate-nucleotide adenylyltransferase